MIRKIAVLFSVVVSLAVCATAQNYPFPQHVTYAAGIKPNNVSQSSMDSTVTSFWSAYSSRYIKSASTGGYYIAYNLENQGDPGAATVSEAHGYGMVLCAYMGDKTHFDGMYTYYKNHPSDNNSYLMAWEQHTNTFADMNGADSATDGDMDIAYSLLLADKQWGSSGAINYLQAATNMINALMQSDVNQSQWTLRLGDWATSGTSQGFAYATSTRPSDFMFDHMWAYYYATGDGRWTNVINQTYAVVNTLFNNNSPNTGLISDFVVLNGSTYQPAPATFLEGPTDGEYNYNSCRTPWRFATEYLLSGSSGILSEMRKMNSWIQSSSGGNPNNVYPGYTLGGTALDKSYTDDSFTSPFALCSMIDSGNQSWLNTLWSWIAARGINVNDGYFGDSITMQCVIVLSGNWWQPAYGSTADFNISATPSSQSATVGNGTSYTVNIGSVGGFSGNVALTASGFPAGASGTFGPASVSGSGSSTLTVTTANTTPGGTYTLTITGTSGSLVHSTTVSLVLSDFIVSATPGSAAVTVGGSTNYSISVGNINAFGGTVNLTSSGLPSGATGSFNPSSISGLGTSTFTVSTTSSTAPGTYPVAVTGTSGAIVHSTNVTLVINSVGLSWTTVNDTDPSVTYSSGWSYGTNRNYGDYNNDVHYTTGTSNYASYTFTGTGVEYITETYSDEGNVDVYLDGAYQTTVNCNSSTRQAQVVAYSNTGLASGSHTLKVVKNSGTYMLVDAFAYTTASAGNFALSASPTSQSVVEGSGTSYTITVNPSGGFNGTVNLGVTGLGVGTTASFNPSSISGGSGSSTLTVTTTSATPGANGYSLTVTGTSGSLTNTVGLNLTVNPPSPGGPLPTGWTDTDVGGPLYLPGSAGYTSGLFTVNGSGADIWTPGDEFHYVYQTVTNSGETIIAEVTSLQNTDPWARAGVMFRETVSSNSTDVGLYVTISNGVSMQYRNGTGTGGMDLARQTGLTAPYWVELVRSGNTFTGYSSPDGSTWTQVGTTNVTMATTATAGLAVGAHNYWELNTATFTNVSLTLPASDFSLSASPSSQTVTTGNNTTYTETVTALNGFTGNVALAVSGLPSGATGTFNPTSVSGSGNSTLTVTTAASTPTGTYTLTITGTSGNLAHSNTVTLVVNSPAWTEVNDTDPNITYNSGWSYSTNRNDGDYNNDVHYTKTAANYAQYTFTGTSIEYITETYSDEGNVDVYIDGTLQTTVNCNSSTRAAQVVMYSNTSLTYGSHTIKVVKNSGTYMLLDAFSYR